MTDLTEEKTDKSSMKIPGLAAFTADSTTNDDAVPELADQRDDSSPDLEDQHGDNQRRDWVSDKMFEDVDLYTAIIISHAIRVRVVWCK